MGVRYTLPRHSGYSQQLGSSLDSINNVCSLHTVLNAEAPSLRVKLRTEVRRSQGALTSHTSATCFGDIDLPSPRSGRTIFAAQWVVCIIRYHGSKGLVQSNLPAHEYEQRQQCFEQTWHPQRLDGANAAPLSGVPCLHHHTPYRRLYSPGTTAKEELLWMAPTRIYGLLGLFYSAQVYILPCSW